MSLHLPRGNYPHHDPEPRDRAAAATDPVSSRRRPPAERPRLTYVGSGPFRVLRLVRP